MKPRDNPFASHRIENLAFRLPGGLTWDTFLERCAAAKWRGTIVGPHGSGKSTLLEQMFPHLRQRGFTPLLFRVNAETSTVERISIIDRVRTMRAPDFLLLDGAEQFSTREWLTLYSTAGALAGCLITVHRTSRLPTLLETKTSPALLTELTAELTGNPLPELEATALFRRHFGNLRECLRTLYDRHALA